MRRRFPFTALVFCFLLTPTGCVRSAIIGHLEKDAFVTPQPGRLTPDSLGVPSKQFFFSSGRHSLHGSFVQAPGDTAPGVLIFHGDDETVSDWAGIQAALFRWGVSSLVFNYSGYGSSGGRPTMTQLRRDGLAAFQEFAARLPAGSRRYALGFSLGSAVLLDIGPEVQAEMDGLVVVSGFASTREMAVSQGRVPRWLAGLLPDLWNNERQLRAIRKPVLIVHSRSDRVVPYGHAVRLSRAARVHHRLILVDSAEHAAALQESARNRIWDPIICYLRSGSVQAATRRCSA